MFVFHERNIAFNDNVATIQCYLENAQLSSRSLCFQQFGIIIAKTEVLESRFQPFPLVSLFHRRSETNRRVTSYYKVSHYLIVRSLIINILEPQTRGFFLFSNSRENDFSTHRSWKTSLVSMMKISGWMIESKTLNLRGFSVKNESWIIIVLRGGF